MADKAPSAWAIEKALAAWKSGIDASGDGDLWLDEKTANVDDVLHRLLQSAVNAGDMAIMAAQREAEIAQRKERYLAREKALRAIVLDLMTTLGRKSAEFADVSVTLSAGPRSVIVTDQSKIPSDFMVTTTTSSPMKAKIKEHLGYGAVIGGVELSNAPTVLTIRTK